MKNSGQNARQKTAQPARLTGTRIRERRLSRGLRQGDLARQVGISPAYLNLIEHNRRRIGGKLLVEIARALGAEATDLSEGAEAHLVAILTAAATRQQPGGDGPDAAELDRVGEFIGRFPGWAAVVAAQHARTRELERLVEALSDRLSHDPQLAATLHEILSTVTAIRSAVSILSDEGEVDPEWQARFLRNVAEDATRLTDAARVLTGFLESGQAEPRAHMSPQEELAAFLDAHDYHFPALEPGGRGVAADLAHAPGTGLDSEAARDLAARWLTRYAADARAMPAGEFAPRWRGSGLDPVPVAAHFGVGPAAVLRRAACLGPEAGAGQAGLVVCDGTGTLTTRLPIAGFPVPRFGATCARWPLYQALTQPGRALRARVVMPGEPAADFTCIAIATLDWPGGMQALPVVEATMLIVPGAAGDPGAGPTVFAGPGCRVCPRAGCPARREMSLLALEDAPDAAV